MIEFVLIEYLNKRSIWRSQSNHITLYQRVYTKATWNDQEDRSMTFLSMISCHSIQPTLSQPLTQERYHYDFRLQGYHNLSTRLRDTHNLTFSLCSRPHIIHSYITKRLHHPKAKHHSDIIHVTGNGHKTTKQDTHIVHI